MKPELAFVGMDFDILAPLCYNVIKFKFEAAPILFFKRCKGQLFGGIYGFCIFLSEGAKSGVRIITC